MLHGMLNLKNLQRLDPTILFTPIELSMQIYRESLLLSNID
ncbi:Uncharacterised protein [Budvicia aquatica]|uniref:Uncharacterized protein n=1 Tax=Budvicia aquatica TaxID=82979 RepID=A0A484ZQ29_9GAMM|nr:Uncharacterised protein [Budvicia aquatica]